MKRLTLGLIACLVTSLAVAATASAHGSSVRVRGAKQLSATPFSVAGSPKPKEYETLIATLEGEIYNDVTTDLYSKTHTWDQPGFCNGGTYTSVGKDLTLTDTGCGVTLIWSTAKEKHEKGRYFGVVYYEGEAAALTELILK